MQDRPDDRKKGVRVVSLAVHRNTKARRHRHEMSKALVDAAKFLSADKSVEGFFVFAFTDGEMRTLTNCGELDPDLFWAKLGKEAREGAESYEEMEETES